MSRLENLKEWYGGLTRAKQVAYALIAAVLVIALVQGLVTGWLWFESIQQGLTIYLEPQHEHVSLAHGQATTLTYELGVSNAPLCTARCEWELIDHASGQTVANGTQDFSTRVPRTISHELEAPMRGRYTTPVQLVATCSNQPGPYCQLAQETSTASATTATQITFTQQEQTLHEELTDELETYNTNTSDALELLAGITTINDSRIQDVRGQAATQQAALQSHAQQLRAAVTEERLGQAEQLLEDPPATSAATRYQELHAQEHAAVQAYQQLRSDQDALSAIASIANTSDYQQLQTHAQAAIDARDAFAYLPVTDSHDAITQLQTTTQQLRARYDAPALAQSAQELLIQEQTAACTIKNTTCPSTNTSAASNYTQAVEELRTACTQLLDLNTTFAQAHQAYAQQLAANQSVNATEAQHNISSLRNQQNWSAHEQETLRAARNATLLNTSARARLAVRLSASNQTRKFSDEHCPVAQRTISLAPAPQATLAQDPRIPTTFQDITFSEPTCCDESSCGSCEQRETVVYVHGHSFAQSTAPEYSLQAFDELALQLQEEGVYYAGRIFAQQEAQPSYQALKAPLGLAATYYYDSYAEEGELFFVSRKSEGIETYAIRLNEAIEAAKQKSGAQKVTLVTHSMGGLVARSYLHIFGNSSVDGLVMIATPNNGISARAQRLCPLIGGERECTDMRADSLFLRKLPQEIPVPALTITGVGCEQRSFDGVVEADSVRLPGVENINVTGNCSGTYLLHNTLLEPDEHPEVAQLIQRFLNQ